MDSMTLFIASLAVSCIGALASVLLIKADNAAKTAGCLIGAAAAVLSFVAGIQAVLGDVTSVDTIVFFPFAHFQLLLNQLSGLFVALISVLAFAGSIYGLNYFDEYPGKKGRAGFFFNTFVASMMLVITADNVFWFLVAFELMSLTSYFLVVIEENENSIHGGWLYFVIAHVGFVLIMASFLTMTNFAGGSFSLCVISARTQFSPAVASVCFVLAFFGFGAKAGIIPLHGWLPKAHPEAPSNVSALMSGGMIKIGIFGILKVGLDLLSASGVQVWWGLMVMVFGAISSVLGVAFALQEHDIKRLLAYHSVENIGIILARRRRLHGRAWRWATRSASPSLALMAALYHTFNHAMFKGELFLGAGALLYSTGTRNMEKMGGLFRRMPATAICFLVGALAISAIPPFNGFVSEWFTYQSLFNAAMQGDKAVMIVRRRLRCRRACHYRRPGRHVLRQGLWRLLCLRTPLRGRGQCQGGSRTHGVCAGPARGHLRRAGHWRSRDRARAGRCRRVRAASVRWRVCRRGHGAHEPVFRRCHLHARDRHCARGARRPCLRLSQAQDRRQGAEVPAVGMRLCSQRAYARRGHDLCLRGRPGLCSPLYTLRDRMHGTICWSIAHVFQKLTGVAEGCGARARQGSSSMPRSKGVEKLADLATKLEGGNYSVYICYIVAALVVFLVLAVVKWV